MIRKAARHKGNWTAPLFRVVRKYFYTERCGTCGIARLAITELGWAKLNGEVCYDDEKEIKAGDVVSFKYGQQGDGWANMTMTEKTLEECY